MDYALLSPPACQLASCLHKPAALAAPAATVAALSPLASKAERFPSSATFTMQPAKLRIGIGRIRASTASSEAAALGPITVYTVDGRPVQFQELWDQNEGMAVVAFLRHFGCIFCWEFAASLRDAKPKFDAAGAKLIAIGVGTPDKAQILAKRTAFPKDCLYADPSRKAYNSLGLYYGLSRTFFNPASAQALGRMFSIQKSLKGYTISATPDDKSSTLQQGGLYVFKGKELLYFRKDEGTGDHAPLDEVLKVCCPAVPA
eukprot:c24618_g1_i1 orf=394-1170(+)